MITCYECGTAQNAEPSDDCANCHARIGIACRDCGHMFAINDINDERRCDECADVRELQLEHERRCADEHARDRMEHSP